MARFRVKEQSCEKCYLYVPFLVNEFGFWVYFSYTTLTSDILTNVLLQKRDQKKIVTGYILYSGDVRKGIAADNPTCSFGEVSRMVGNEVKITRHVANLYNG